MFFRVQAAPRRAEAPTDTQGPASNSEGAERPRHIDAWNPSGKV